MQCAPFPCLSSNKVGPTLSFRGIGNGLRASLEGESDEGGKGVWVLPLPYLLHLMPHVTWDT